MNLCSVHVDIVYIQRDGCPCCKLEAELDEALESIRRLRRELTEFHWKPGDNGAGINCPLKYLQLTSPSFT